MPTNTPDNTEPITPIDNVAIDITKGDKKQENIKIEDNYSQSSVPIATNDTRLQKLKQLVKPNK